MTAELVNTEIPRDHYGRPLVMPPGRNRKKRVPYRRVTTFVGALEDTYNLMAWKQRQVAYGMGQRKDLVLAAAAAKPDDRNKLNDIAAQATEYAQASASATTGTALHALTESIDLDQPLGFIPTEYQPDLDAYQKTVAAIRFTAVETFRVYDRWQVAGTADRIGRDPRGRLRVYDIKTGSIDYPHKMAMQLAMYARSLPYDVETDTRGDPEDGLDLNTGIIIHLPAGQGRCDLYEVDILKGWGACLIAKQVWDWRATKGLTQLVDPDAPAPEYPTWETLVRDARDVDDLRLIWQRAKQYGDLTDELRQLCTRRSKELVR